MSIVDGIAVVIPPPEGYVVDFDNPQRNSVVAIYVLSSCGMALALLFLAQRLYVKAFIRIKLGIDDAVQVLAIRSFADGWMGVHAWEISFDKFQEATFWGTYISSIIYTVPTDFSKIVILLFLLELNSNQAWYRWTLYVGMSLVAGSSLGIFFSHVGSCIDRWAMFQATAGLSVATDVLIIAIPVPTIIRLHLSVKRRLPFWLCLTVITSMIRLGLLISQLEQTDTTWGGGPIYVWICIEANLLIICACLSTLRHFVKTVAPRLLSGTRGTDTGTSKIKAGLSSGHELQTVQGTGRSVNRPQCVQFDETFRTTTRAEAGFGWKNRDERSESIDGKSSNDDERSDSGIMQTTTTEVYYQDAHAA
ncbi:hypothetical protein EDB81DRAFT_846919 [Dactylonectria macrodidyma]|uniref:Rhodopsin domain-containing protein n=1 Tax=Dactylonectria macrodidyma TaxID=307937 RepID=A0A9P9DSR7_9HYPO|nr:hypothetical protein EDB81DRAFT_846919 [Dactylonectria macrodidyma]